MSKQGFSYKFTATLHDIDAAGVMFFAHLLRHAHDGYEAFMQHIGFGLDSILQQGDYHLPLVYSETEFSAPIRHGDEISIRLQVEEIGRSSFTLNYLCSDEEDRMMAQLRTVHVAQKPGAIESMPLPDELRIALKPHLGFS